MNDVKSEYNTPQQSGHVMTAWYHGVTVSSAGAGSRLSAGTGPCCWSPVCLHTAVWSSHLSDTLQQTCKQCFTMFRMERTKPSAFSSVKAKKHLLHLHHFKWMYNQIEDSNKSLDLRCKICSSDWLNKDKAICSITISSEYCTLHSAHCQASLKCLLRLTSI